MIVAGVDIGASTSKAVLLSGDQILSHSIIATGAESANSAHLAMEEAINRASISLKDTAYIVATGYERVIVPFAQAFHNDAYTRLPPWISPIRWGALNSLTTLTAGTEFLVTTQPWYPFLPEISMPNSICQCKNQRRSQTRACRAVSVFLSRSYSPHRALPSGVTM